MLVLVRKRGQGKADGRSLLLPSGTLARALLGGHVALELLEHVGAAITERRVVGVHSSGPRRLIDGLLLAMTTRLACCGRALTKLFILGWVLSNLQRLTCCGRRVFLLQDELRAIVFTLPAVVSVVISTVGT